MQGDLENSASMLEFSPQESDNKKMWRVKIHPFEKDPTLPEGREVAIRRGCEISGCPHLGEYRAPKSRDDLRSYYWFCLDHVREYNQNWDFFKGMNRVEIEHHMHKTMVWDRPSWRTTETHDLDKSLRQKIYARFTREDIFADFSMRGDGDDADTDSAHVSIGATPHPTLEALTTLNLAPPVTWPLIKTRYKQLAKQHHPDTNRGDPQAEEAFKKISIAYHILKLSYQHITEQDPPR